MILSFDVNQQTVSRSAVTSVPRRGSREYLYLSFTFSDDWTGLTKTLYVSNETYSDGIIVEKGVPVQVPIYYTQQNSFSITLCGIRGNQFVPTNVITILLEESNDTWEEVAPDPESIPYQQLIAMVQKAIEAMHAPYINTDTNTWMQWSIEQNMFVDTGIVAESATYAAQAQTASTSALAAQAAAESARLDAQSFAHIAENAAAAATGATSIYGVRFTGGTNPGTRIYQADGLTANVCIGDPQEVANDFDNIYPWSARKRCCGYWNDDGNFVVNAYEGEPGYAIDGSNGEVWIEHSLFYYRHTMNAEGGIEEYLISSDPASGFKPAPIFDRGAEAPLQKAYTAAYPLAFVDSVPTSRSGVYSSTTAFNTIMKNLQAINVNYRTTTVAEWFTEMLYCVVEFATRNLQAIMKGADNLSYTANCLALIDAANSNTITVDTTYASTYVVGQCIGIGTSQGGNQVANNRTITNIATTSIGTQITFDGDPVNIASGNLLYSLAYRNGACDEYAGIASSGTKANSGKYQCIYRGKESPWANAFEALSDVLTTSNFEIYYLPDTRNYSNGQITSDYVKLDGNIPSTDGFVKEFQRDERYPWVEYPKSIGASDTTYYSDYYYYPRSEITIPRIGGDWHYGTYSGPAYWYCYSMPSSALVTSHARLSFRKP